VATPLLFSIRRRITDALSHCVESLKRVLQSRGFIGQKERALDAGAWRALLLQVPPVGVPVFTPAW
jgi:hypothetical protein